MSELPSRSPVSTCEQAALFQAPSALEQAIERAETDWQRAAIAEWARLHPKPKSGIFGRLGLIEFFPIPCGCTRCGTPSLIVPGETDELPESAGYCICPQCSLQKVMEASA